MTPLRAHVRGVLAHVTRALHGRDLALWAAGLTFFATLALVPMLLLALRGAAVLLGGHAELLDRARGLGAALPAAHDATGLLVALARAAVDASWPVLLAALLPASLYGEGLRRALTQVAGLPATGLTGWAGRLGFLPVLFAGPVLLAVPLLLVDVVAPLYAAGGWSTVLGVVVSFHVDWVPVSLVIALVVARTGPSVLPARAALVTGICLGAVLTGFLHGFLVFLAIPLDWSIPFGGLTTVGVVAALALWMFALHAVLLLGYRVALSAHRVVTAESEDDGTDDGTDGDTNNSDTNNSDTNNSDTREGERDGTVRSGSRPLAGRRTGAATGAARLD